MKEFIDEFKHLVKICNEIYSEQHGVTQYINEMEQKSGYASRKIPDWDKDLTNLKRVRHIRNNLVHESDETVDYNSYDIEFIKRFYHKIITQQDPLSLITASLIMRLLYPVERVMVEFTGCGFKSCRPYCSKWR